jgi:hypothetical protein
MFNFMSDMSSVLSTSLDLDRSLPRFTILANNNWVLIVPG